jgi:hypothetical protein
MRPGVTLASLLAGLLAAQVGAAADSPAAEAAQHLANAAALHTEGKLADACDEYQRAYDLEKSASAVIGLAACNNELEHYEKTVLLVDALLASGRATTKQLKRAERLRDEAQRKLALLPPEETPPAAPPPAEKPKDEPVEKELPPNLQSTPPPAKPAPEAIRGATPTPPRRTMLYAGIGVAALGVAALAVGSGLGARSLSLSGQLTDFANNRLQWSPQEQALQDEGQRDATIATAMYVVGGALVAAGGVVAILGWRRSVAERPRIAVDLAPGRAQLVAEGRF